MASPSIVGVRRGKHWHGTYVGYDGGLEQLGTKLVELVLTLEGNLEEVWSRVASPPDGWRHAFTEPYEEGFNTGYFGTGRTGAPLLTDEDPFVRQNAVCWYIFDLDQRTLDVYEVPEEGSEWPCIARVAFETDGTPRFELRHARAEQERLTPDSQYVADWAAAMERTTDR